VSRRWGIAFLVLVWLAAAPSVAQEAAEARQAIGHTGVSLLVPTGFKSSEDFPGIGRAEDLSSVMVTELDVPQSAAAEAFTQPALERRGIAVASTRPITVDGRETSLIEATQKIGSMTFRKWFVLLGSDTRSVLLTATTPVEYEGQHREALVHVLESARWSEASGPAPAVALSFQVKEVPPLRIVRSGNDSIVLSDPEVVKGHVAPLVTVGASQARVDASDLAAFAKSRLEETTSLHEISVEEQGPRALGSLQGYQITAKAKDTESGRPVRVRQILASDGSRYFLVQGIFDADDATRLGPAFEGVATSFKLRDASAGAAGERSEASRPARSDAKPSGDRTDLPSEGRKGS